MFNADEGFEVWYDDRTRKIFPLQYFMGKEFAEYDTEEPDRKPLFTDIFKNRFGSLFSDTNIGTLNYLFRNRFSDLIVKPCYYVKKGAWTEEKEVPFNYPIYVEGVATFGGESVGITVFCKYYWDGELKEDFLTYTPANHSETRMVIYADSEGIHGTYTPFPIIDAEIAYDSSRDVWEIAGAVEYPVQHHTGTKTITIPHTAGTQPDRDLTLEALEYIACQVGDLHADEWETYKAIADGYNLAGRSGDLFRNVDIKYNTNNMTDTETGSVARSETQTPNGWKTTVTPTGSESGTSTDYRTGNTTGDDFHKQTKTETSTSFTNRKTETEQTGTMQTDGTTRYDNHTHTINGERTERGYRGLNRFEEFTRAFDRKGLEWLTKVVDDIAKEFLIMAKII